MNVLKTVLGMQNTLPDEAEQIVLCRNSEEFQTFVKQVRENPCRNEYHMKLYHHTGEISSILKQCITQYNFKIKETIDSYGVDKVLHAGHVESVPCTFVTIIRA